MHLHYLVKLPIHVFCENSNAGKAKLKKVYLLTLVLLIKKMQLFDFDTKLWQTESGKHAPNLIRIGLVSEMI